MLLTKQEIAEKAKEKLFFKSYYKYTFVYASEDGEIKAYLDSDSLAIYRTDLKSPMTVEELESCGFELANDEPWDDDSLEAQAKRWTEQSIKSESAGVIIAPEDLYIIDDDGERKTEFTADEADELIAKLPDGWRLPTYQEMLQILAEKCFDDAGQVKQVEDTIFKRDGNWWSATAYSATLRYRLHYDGSQFYSTYNGRYLGFFVRCVRS